MIYRIKDGFKLTSNDIEPSGVFTDPRDNKQYPYATIGNQTWMLTNIEYGTRVDVPTNQTGSTWTQAEGTCYKYKNVDNYGSWTDGSRGGFYLFSSLSWVCPTGWHVPTKAEYDTLTSYVAETYGSSSSTGMPMGALMSTTHWYNATYAKTDAYGFKLLPTGQCYKRTTSTAVNWDKSETTDTTARIWVANDIGTSNVSFVEVGSNTWQNFPMSEWTPSTGFTLALPVRLIKDSVPEDKGPDIEKIVVEISDDPSDNNLPTESAVDAFVEPIIPSVENYSLSLSDSTSESSSETENKIHFSKVFCTTTRKVTRMGFFHKSQTQGVIGMGIYNTTGSALATTEVSGVTTATEGHVCWKDLTTPITLERGKEYWFAFFEGWASGEWNCNINFARNTAISGAGNTIIITYNLGSGTTAMPASMTGSNEGQFVPWIVAD